MSDIDEIDSDSEIDTSDAGSEDLSPVDDIDDPYSDYEQRSDRSSSIHSATTPSIISGTSKGSSDQPALPIEDSEVDEIFPSGIFQKIHFQEMDSKEFIESLTHKLLGRIRSAEGGGKNSKNDRTKNESGYVGMDVDEVQNAINQFRRTQKHIRLFNALFSLSVRKLEKIRHQSHTDLKSLHERNQESIGKYMKELHESNLSLDLVSEQAKHLEEGLGEIGNQIIQTGHVLTQLNSQKDRAILIKKLLDFFNEFNRYPVKDFLSVIREKKFRFRVFNERSKQTAAVRIIQQLKNIIVPELESLRNCRQGIKNIQTFHNFLMNILRNRFSRALRKEDVLLIRRRANILFEVGYLDKCITMFALKIYNEFIGLKKDFVLPEDLEKDEDEEDDDEEILDQDEVSDGYEKDIRRIMEEDEGEEDDDDDDNNFYGKSNYNDDDDDDNNNSRRIPPSTPKEFLDDEIENEEKQKTMKREQRRKDFREKRKAEKQQKLKKKIDEQTHKLNQLVIELRKNILEEYGTVDKFRSLLRKVHKTCIPYRDMIEKVFGMERRNQVFLFIFHTIIQQILAKTVDHIFNESLRRQKLEEGSGGAGNYVDPTTPVPGGGREEHHDHSTFSVSRQKGGARQILELELQKIKEDENFLADFSKIYDDVQRFIKMVTDEEYPQDCLGIDYASLHQEFEGLFKKQKEEYINKELSLQDLVSKVTITKATRVVKMTQENKKKKKNNPKKKGGRKGDLKQMIIDRKTNLMSPIRQGARILGADKIELIDFQFEKMLHVQHCNRDALERCILLSSKEEVHENVIEIFKIFIDFGHRYMVRGLQCSIKEFKMSYTDPGEPPPTQKLFDDISTCFMIMSKTQQHMTTDVLERLGGSYLLQNKCWKLRHELFSKLEAQIELGLKKMFTRIITYSANCLKLYYNKNDYRSSRDNRNDDDDFMAVISCSKYVKVTLGFLKKQLDCINRALFHSNKLHFLEKLGVEFYRAYVRFLHKVRVSQKLRCSMQFKRDVEEFKSFFDQFKSKAVDSKFENLRSLCGIVSVVTENVEEVCKTMKEDEDIEKDLIVLFVKMREDYKNIKFSPENVFGFSSKKN